MPVGERTGSIIHQDTARSVVASMGRVAAQFGTQRMLVGHGLFGLGLVPIQFWNELISDHDQTGADITIATDLPSPLFAAVCEGKILQMLGALPPDVALPEDASLSLRKLAEAANHQGERIVMRTKSFLQHYGVGWEYVARYIPSASAADFRLLEQAIENSVGVRSGGPLEGLVNLRSILVEQLERTHRRRSSQPTSISPLRRRILYASNPSAFSGGEQCLVSTVQALGRYDIELHCLVALEGVFTERLRAAGAVVHCPHRDFGTANIPTFVQLDAFLEQVQPDLIHCNGIVGPPLLALSRLKGIPLAQWARVAEMESLSAHLVAADSITAVSKFIARRASEELIRPQKVHVLYDPVDCGHFSQSTQTTRDIRRDLGIGPKEFMVLCVARFVPYKRHDVLMRAVALARQTHCNIRLVLVGEPETGRQDYYCSCMEQLRSLDLARSTLVLGFQQDIRSVEAASDAVVVCSDNEPLGTVVLESMALERPIIVSASGGLPEMIEDEITGLHCVPGDHSSLARQLCRICEETALGTHLGANARARAIERFSLEAHARSLLSIYEQILGQPLVPGTSA